MLGSWAKSRGVKEDLWRMLRWSICVCPALRADRDMACPLLFLGRRAEGPQHLGRTGQVLHHPAQGFLLIVKQSCEVSEGAERGAGVNGTGYFMLTVYIIQKKKYFVGLH